MVGANFKALKDEIIKAGRLLVNVTSPAGEVHAPADRRTLIVGAVRALDDRLRVFPISRDAAVRANMEPGVSDDDFIIPSYDESDNIVRMLGRLVGEIKGRWTLETAAYMKAFASYYDGWSQDQDGAPFAPPPGGDDRLNPVEAPPDLLPDEARRLEDILTRFELAGDRGEPLSVHRGASSQLSACPGGTGTRAAGVMEAGVDGKASGDGPDPAPPHPDGAVGGREVETQAAPRLSLSDEKQAVSVDNVQHYIPNKLVYYSYKKVVESNGETISAHRISKGRIDRKFRSHLPAAVLDTIGSSSGHGGGYFLKPEFCSRPDDGRK